MPAMLDIGKRTRKGRAGQRRRVQDDGQWFDSVAEHRRWCELKILVRIGDIRDLAVHPSYVLTVAGEDICAFIPDFRYVTREGEVRIEDVKSPMTRQLAEYRIKVKLFEAIYRLKVNEVVAGKGLRRPRRRWQPT